MVDSYGFTGIVRDSFFLTMSIFRPFQGFRPVPEKAKAVASRPYDVLNSEEARKEAEGNPDSFLHVVKPEIDLPEETDLYSEAVYKKAVENYSKMEESGVFVQDDKPCFYLYELTMDGRSQIGIVGCSEVGEYFDGKIKKHELTRQAKEEDRKNHIRYTDMNAEPVFFTYRAEEEIDKLVQSKASSADPVYDFTADDGIRHRFWVVDDEEWIQAVEKKFAAVPEVYVADGHHRTAAAALVGKERREANADHNGQEEYNFFLSVLFPDNQLKIFDYNRVVTDLNGLSGGAFLEMLGAKFRIKEMGTEPYRPEELHVLSMYLAGKWYRMEARMGTYSETDPIRSLDVTVLSDCVLDPIFDIGDLRKSNRIDFVGGIRGLGELSRRVESGEMAVGFALYPVSMDQLLNIADTGNIMPPKTTWFEPKLRSGLVVHKLV